MANSKKLRRSAKGFYKTIGSRGGVSTMKNHGSEFFARLARLSHKARRAARRAKTNAAAAA